MKFESDYNKHLTTETTENLFCEIMTRVDLVAIIFETGENMISGPYRIITSHEEIKNLPTSVNTPEYLLEISTTDLFNELSKRASCVYLIFEDGEFWKSNKHRSNEIKMTKLIKIPEQNQMNKAVSTSSLPF